ncbi:MAG: hypothetical protein RIM80_20695, partial [Alphaproteobacteria bacterium]
AGDAVDQGTPALYARVVAIEDHRPKGVVVSDNHSPQQARVLLMLALAHGMTSPEALPAAFDTY